MNYREYKRYVEGLVIFSDMGFKVRKHWTSELSVDLLEKGINHEASSSLIRKPKI